MLNSIRTSDKNITLQVSVFLFKEDGSHIAYCPSLDLSGYGSTQAEAKQDLKFILNHYILDQVENGTLAADLQAHGWHIQQDGSAIEPSFADTVRRSSSLRTLGEKEFSKRNVRVSQPQRQACFA